MSVFSTELINKLGYFVSFALKLPLLVSLFHCFVFYDDASNCHQCHRAELGLKLPTVL